MLQPKKTNDKSKSDFLHPLQRKILLFLAVNEPNNKHAIASAISEHPTSTRKSLKSLEESRLIVKIDKRMFLGVKRDCYWLTDSGVFLALIEGAEPKKVLNKTKEIYPENKPLLCVIETTPIIGSVMHKIAYSAVLTKGKLDESDKGAMFGAQSQKDLSLEQIIELIAILKKYQVRDLQAELAEITEKMKKAELFLREANKQQQT
jgi:hypothetical protein